MARAPKKPGDSSPVAARIRAAGERARAEAEARQAEASSPKSRAKEIGGPQGPEPTRFGDWERKGIASNF